MAIECVGVVGAGVIGRGVTEVVAGAGIPVILVDNAESALTAARQEIGRSLRFRGLMREHGANIEPAGDVLARIHFTGNDAALAEVDFLVENATESWPVKAEIYPRIDATCRPDCIFAANTSCISITRLASLTRRPEQVIGVHFMNPVPAIAAVEVVRSFHTSEATVDITRVFLDLIGKTGIVVGDMPGFVSNRVLMLAINEAIFVLQDQVATAENIDRIFRECFGHKMGPLETADLIGLDTILYSLEVLYESYNHDKFRPASLLREMVHAGLLGQKSGRGFHHYDGS